ncbi:MAG: sulfurtransferase [Nitrosopumilaceae archaeon]|nr:sulfurtransferase [Nitrosopumilaceae archaeon]
MLIAVDHLGDLLAGSDDLVVVDARPFSEYAKGHIPGAVNLDLFAFHWNDTSARGMAEFDRQAARLLGFTGVTRDRTVVVYDGQSGMLAARGVWMLRYMSHDNSYMLDGGFGTWQGESRPVEMKTNAPKPAEFEPRPDPSVLAGYEYVAGNLDRLILVDARSPEEYDGTVSRAARAGHIPGATNIDWSGNLAGDGRLKDGSRLAEMYGDIPRDSEIVTYCQGAYRAANSFVALKAMGFENVRVYLGSWGEWGNMPGLPSEV